MKNLRLISAIVTIGAILIMSACTKQSSSNLKSSTIAVKAIASSAAASSSSQAYQVVTAYANLANLRIEENSGNDGENVGGGDNDSIPDNDSIENGGEEGGNDSIPDNDTIQNESENGGNDGGENGNDGGTDNSDISLPGPFMMDIASGTASLGQVSVYPGTFKKVNFDFQTTTSLNNHSIVVTGNYTAADGTTTPFTINSTFTKKVQMLLANGGVTVTANSTVVIDIVFDVNAWLSGVDFASATISNDEILVDNTHNTALLDTFEANLNTYVEQENK